MEARCPRRVDIAGLVGCRRRAGRDQQRDRAWNCRYLAGRPAVRNGAERRFSGGRRRALDSPVLASSGLSLTAGGALTITATGSTDYNGCASPSPDGGGACGGNSFAAALGVSGYTGPINALIGVFLDASVPSGPNPPTLDFSTPGSTAQPTISPALRQAFFIGDGRTGTGSGSAQQFIVPAGATRLLLASSDGIGANYNNFGSFSVVLSDGVAAVGTADVPVNLGRWR